MENPSPVKGPDLKEREASNRRLALKLVMVALAFTLFGFLLVPLYDVICRVTGLNGKTNAMAIEAPRNGVVQEDRWVTVEFLSNPMPGVPLTVKPAQFSLKVHPGAVIHTSYIARNTSRDVVIAQAVPSVTPPQAAAHFKKIECFCFNQQTFQPGETKTMPLTFVVEPEFRADLHVITLSYSFFEAPKS
jgi:cytochrome c oxidase assembly protein subunit 11